MTVEIKDLAMALTAGMLLGLFYFGGLWLTVRRLPELQNPGFVLFVSFLVRMGVALTVLYVVMAGQWKRLVASVVGFLIMRHILVRYVGRQNARLSSTRLS